MKLVLMQDGVELEVAEGDANIFSMVNRLQTRFRSRGTVARSTTKAQYGTYKASIVKLMKDEGLTYYQADGRLRRAREKAKREAVA